METESNIYKSVISLDGVYLHYKNMPIQLYRIIHLQKMKIFR